MRHGSKPLLLRLCDAIRTPGDSLRRGQSARNASAVSTIGHAEIATSNPKTSNSMMNDHLDSFLNSSSDFRSETRLRLLRWATTMRRGFIRFCCARSIRPLRNASRYKPLQSSYDCVTETNDLTSGGIRRRTKADARENLRRTDASSRFGFRQRDIGAVDGAVRRHVLAEIGGGYAFA